MKISIWSLALSAAFSSTIFFQFRPSLKGSAITLKNTGASLLIIQERQTTRTLSTTRPWHNPRAYVRLHQLSSTQQLTSAQQADAVKSVGMEPIAYKHVMMLVENDKTLRHKFMGYVQQYGGANLPAPVPH